MTKIIDSEKMTLGMARYWNCKARKEKRVDYLDPWRYSIRELKARGFKGKIYRASTGGTWGKSAQIIELN